MSRRCVVLVGMMGAGKTEVGEMLADRLGYAFVDTDDLIVEKAGRTVPELFKELGESEFRRLEREAIESLAGSRACVIATGGGAVTDPSNRKDFKVLGHVAYLKASPRELFLRVKNDRNRPLLQVQNPEKELARILGERAMHYEDADIIIDTEEIGADEAVDALIDELAKRTVETETGME